MTDIVVWHRADLRTADNAALADRAEEALSDPRVRRRCSFSSRGRDRRGDSDDEADGQASLSDF